MCEESTSENRNPHLRSLMHVHNTQNNQVPEEAPITIDPDLEEEQEKLPTPCTR